MKPATLPSNIGLVPEPGQATPSTFGHVSPLGNPERKPTRLEPLLSVTGPSMRSVLAPLSTPAAPFPPAPIDTSGKSPVPVTPKAQAYTSTSSTTPSTEGRRNNSPKPDFKSDLGMLLRGIDLEGQRQRDLEASLETALDECKEKIEAEHASVLSKLETDLERVRKEKKEEVEKAEVKLDLIVNTNREKIEVLKMNMEAEFAEKEEVMRSDLNAKYEMLELEYKQKWDLKREQDEKKQEADTIAAKKRLEEKSQIDLQAFEAKIAAEAQCRREALRRESEQAVEDQKTVVYEAMQSHSDEKMVLMAKEMRQHVEISKNTLMQFLLEEAEESDRIKKEVAEFEVKRASLRESLEREQAEKIATLMETVKEHHEHQMADLLLKLGTKSAKGFEEAEDKLIGKLEDQRIALMERLNDKLASNMSVLAEDIIQHVQQVNLPLSKSKNREEIATQTDRLVLGISPPVAEPTDAQYNSCQLSENGHKFEPSSKYETLVCTAGFKSFDVKTAHLTHKQMITEQMTEEFDKVKRYLEEELLQKKSELETKLRQSIAEVEAELKVSQLAELNKMKEHHMMHLVRADDYLDAAIKSSKVKVPMNAMGSSTKSIAELQGPEVQKGNTLGSSPINDIYQKAPELRSETSAQVADFRSSMIENWQEPVGVAQQADFCRLRADIAQDLRHIIDEALSLSRKIDCKDVMSATLPGDPETSIENMHSESLKDMLQSIFREAVLALKTDWALSTDIDPVSAAQGTSTYPCKKELSQTHCSAIHMDEHERNSKVHQQLPASLQKLSTILQKQSKDNKSSSGVHGINQTTTLQALKEFMRIQDRLYRKRRKQIQNSREKWTHQWREMSNENNCDVLHAKQAILLDMWATLEAHAQQLNSDISNMDNLRARLRSMDAALKANSINNKSMTTVRIHKSLVQEVLEELCRKPPQ